MPPMCWVWSSQGLRSVLDAAGLRALHRLVGQVATRVEVGVAGVDAQVGSPRP